MLYVPWFDRFDLTSTVKEFPSAYVKIHDIYIYDAYDLLDMIIRRERRRKLPEPRKILPYSTYRIQDFLKDLSELTSQLWKTIMSGARFLGEY